ncbi:response regulator [Litorivivens sp.]|uniref:response regulator n=1 Tax=Litorivivens sp. TaxID=2020868 RepID=UPI00356581CF
MATILLVEDDEMNRDMLRRRLVKRDFSVITAEDGVKAIAAAQAQAPDLILLDMSLPLKDGWQTAGELKADAQTAAIPIIALTAHAMDGDRQRALAAGCDDYDTKPVDFKRLLVKIQAHLDAGA